MTKEKKDSYLIIPAMFMRGRVITIEKLYPNEVKKIKRRKKMARFEGEFWIKEPFGFIN